MATYGVGVQNRFSALFDDEDGYGPSSVSAKVAAAVAISRLNGLGASKTLPKASTNKSNNKTAAVSANHKPSNKPETTQKGIQPKGAATADANKSNRNNYQQQPKQTQKNPRFNNNPGNRSENGYRGDQHDVAITNNSFSRNNSHYSIGNHNNEGHRHSQGQHSDRDVGDGTQGKFARNNNYISNGQPRPRRNFFATNNQNGDEKKNGEEPVGSNFDEEKRRRQQKRALDMKFKDPEKRESRRQQMTEQRENTAISTNGSQPVNGNENAFGPRSFKGRRNPEERSFKNDRPEDGQKSFRNKRELNGTDGPAAGPRDGQQINRGPRNFPGGNDRPQRNRNGFGTGSRNSRNSRSEDGKHNDHPKPIPNFSDKQDFPSLAS